MEKCEELDFSLKGDDASYTTSQYLNLVTSIQNCVIPK